MKSINTQKAYLIDTTKCIGCRGCQVACKQWHELPAEKTQFFSGTGGYQNPATMSASTYTVITFTEVKEKGSAYPTWVFKKDQCQHCLEPACVSACIVRALEKTDDGPVVWHKDKCVGCRYCQIACPYNIPKFEWNSATPDIKKCTLCVDRIAEGKVPSCAQTCPTGAIKYGERGELLAEAKKRVGDNPDKYFQHVFGEHEVGGTNVLYVSNVDLEKAGYPVAKHRTAALGTTTAPAMHAIPGVILGLSVVLGGTAYVINKRIENEKKES